MMFKVCGGNDLTSADLHGPIEAKRNCSECGTYNRRIIMSDGDIHETVCLCGARDFMDTDGYTDRTWLTSEIFRLACLNREGDLHIHIFRSGGDRDPAMDQARRFYRAARYNYSMILPLDGGEEGLVKKARKIAEMIYNDEEQTVWFGHHYPAQYHDDWGGPE